MCYNLLYITLHYIIVYHVKVSYVVLFCHIISQNIISFQIILYDIILHNIILFSTPISPPTQLHLQIQCAILAEDGRFLGYGGFLSHGGTPIAGWFISCGFYWKIHT